MFIALAMNPPNKFFDSFLSQRSFICLNLLGTALSVPSRDFSFPSEDPDEDREEEDSLSDEEEEEGWGGAAFFASLPRKR